MADIAKGYGPLGKLQNNPVDLLVCFAVREEAKFFFPGPLTSCQIWLTGIGRRNAAEAIRKAIPLVKPDRVITAGFAGGLNPELKFGTVVYDEDFDAGLGPDLEELGARPGKFYCHRRVAISVKEKRELWESTGADVIEMESSVIRTICREYRVPSATVRVISDDATQELPLDFNALMTSEDRINYPKLFWAVLSRPGRLSKLVEFQRQTVAAARALGGVLQELLRAERR